MFVPCMSAPLASCARDPSTAPPRSAPSSSPSTAKPGSSSTGPPHRPGLRPRSREAPSTTEPTSRAFAFRPRAARHGPQVNLSSCLTPTQLPNLPGRVRDLDGEVVANCQPQRWFGARPCSRRPDGRKSLSWRRPGNDHLFIGVAFGLLAALIILVLQFLTCFLLIICCFGSSKKPKWPLISIRVAKSILNHR